MVCRELLAAVDLPRALGEYFHEDRWRILRVAIRRRRAARDHHVGIVDAIAKAQLHGFNVGATPAALLSRQKARVNASHNAIVALRCTRHGVHEAFHVLVANVGSVLVGEIVLEGHRAGMGQR